MEKRDELRVEVFKCRWMIKFIFSKFMPKFVYEYLKNWILNCIKMLPYLQAETSGEKLKCNDFF